MDAQVLWRLKPAAQQLYQEDDLGGQATARPVLCNREVKGCHP
jgi:hypothetical protein